MHASLPMKLVVRSTTAVEAVAPSTHLASLDVTFASIKAIFRCLFLPLKHVFLRDDVLAHWSHDRDF